MTREATGKNTIDLGAWQGLLALKGKPDADATKEETALQKALGVGAHSNGQFWMRAKSPTAAIDPQQSF